MDPITVMTLAVLCAFGLMVFLMQLDISRLRKRISELEMALLHLDTNMELTREEVADLVDEVEGLHDALFPGFDDELLPDEEQTA